MQEIDILRENDLPYFEELEREGRAVILRFDSLEQFAKFNLAEYLGTENMKELTLEEVQEWLGSECDVIGKLKARAEEFEQRIKSDTLLKEKYMIAGGTITSSPQEYAMLMALVGAGITKEELERIADPLNYEYRSEMIRQAAAKYQDKETKEDQKGNGAGLT